MKHYIKLSILLCCILSLLIGCSHPKMDRLNRYILAIKARPGGKIEPIPKFDTIPSFSYPESLNKRNPFRPVVSSHVKNQYAPDSRRSKEILEGYPLDSLKFVGTLKENDLIWALIKTPNGQIFRAQVGSYLGQNYGRIMRITADKIIIEERIQNDGQWEKRMTTFQLKTGQ